MCTIYTYGSQVCSQVPGPRGEAAFVLSKLRISDFSARPLANTIHAYIIVIHITIMRIYRLYRVYRATSGYAILHIHVH